MEHLVHAASVYAGVTFLLLVDDIGSVAFQPSWTFETVDPAIDAHWIASTNLGGGVDLGLGPAFVARDLTAYSRVVDCEPEAVWPIHQREDEWRRERSRGRE